MNMKPLLSQEDIELGRKKLLETLRTTKLPQATGELMITVNGNPVAYCAIGALAKEAGATYYQLHASLINVLLRDEYAMTPSDSKVIIAYNDQRGKTFSEIADLMEKRWKIGI